MEDVSLIKIKKNYINYLDKLNDSEEYHTKGNFFRASTAGLCAKKALLTKWIPEEKSKPNEKSLLNFRIGKLIHEDIQNSVKKEPKKGLYNLIEHPDTIKDLSIALTIDWFIVEGKKCNIIDLKTIGSYQWRRKFGRKENRDPNPADNYKYQVGTYGLYAQKEMNLSVNNLSIIYIRKDDGFMRIEDVDLEYIELAEEYWKDVIALEKQYEKEDIIHIPVPNKEKNIPVYNWECNFCDFKNCKSPYRTK